MKTDNQQALPWAGILLGPHLLLDHLGVLCQLLAIPLIVVDPDCCSYAERFYPQLKILFCNPGQIHAVARQFAAIITTGMCWHEEFTPLMELFYGSAPRLIFAPHGHSDKGYSLAREDYPQQDICLVYGPQMQERWQQARVRQLIVTGNYRLHHYRRHAKRQQRQFLQFVGQGFCKERRTLLYAPTWPSAENPTSFFCACETLIRQKPPQWQLLIKLHPNLYQHFPAPTARILARYRHLPGVYFVDTFPLIFALLAHVDLYVGDFSSIGYDFLFFDRPLFFYNPSPDRLTAGQGADLHRCGLTIPAAAYADPYAFIASNLEKNRVDYQQPRQRAWQEAFGQEKSLPQLRAELLAAVGS